MKYRSMKDAPRNRTIVAKHRDGREIRVKWDKRSGPTFDSYSGNRAPRMVEGWCERDAVYVFGASDLIGYREIAENEE